MKNISVLFSVLVLLLVTSLVQAESTQGNARKVIVDVKIDKAIMPADADVWTLYVYAAKPTTRLPLANYKGKLSELPKKIVLTESMYLLPEQTLRQAENIVINVKATKNKNPHVISDEDFLAFSKPISFSGSNTIETSIEVIPAPEARKNK